MSEAASAPSPDSPDAAGASPLRRDAILRAALELMSERSFGRTAVPEIAARAGVAAGTIYRHFADKQALVNAVYQACKADLARHLDAALAGAEGLGAREQGARLWQGLFAFWRARPEALRFLEMHRHQPYLDAESRRVARELFERMAERLARLQQEGGRPREAPEVRVALAFGAFVGFVKEVEAGHLVCDDAALQASERAVQALLAPDAGA